MPLRKLLLLPQLLWYGARAPRDQGAAWERFWSGVKRTGTGGEVLWDAANREELDGVLTRALAHMDRSLPLVDMGCGNGRFSRMFAAHFPRVIGLDFSSAAIRKAADESRGMENLSFRVADASEPGLGRRLAAELGEVNVFMRGVFHVLDAGQRANAVASLCEMLGKRGTLFFSETNYEGDPLDQLLARGVTPTSMPEPLRKCIAAGLRPPRRFGARQLGEIFESHRWETLESGPVTMRGVPLTTRGEPEPIPGFQAILRRRAAGA